jgi:hypothetical protein
MTVWTFKVTDQNVLRRVKNAYRAKRLTFQQYRTLRGQVLAGDAFGAVNGLRKILKTKETPQRDATELYRQL